MTCTHNGVNSTKKRLGDMNMGRIVAIAGGDLLSTRKLNLHTIQLSNKANPPCPFCWNSKLRCRRIYRSNHQRMDKSGL